MLLVKNLEGLLVGLFRIPPGYKAALLVIINQSSVSSSIRCISFSIICISESMPCILVLGDLYCQTFHSFDNIMHITGNANIQHVFNGNYNHGSITIEGTTKDAGAWNG